MKAKAWMTLAAGVVTAGMGTTAYSGAIIYSDAGSVPGDLSGAADALTLFRADLGANNGAAAVPGGNPIFSGRREINWDAGAPLDGVADPNFMPDGQFNGLAAPFARGAQFSTPGTGFFVSRRAAQGGSPLLGFGADFQAFSPERIFAPVGSNVMDVTFAVPGVPNHTATTNAFGAIFVDVEVASLTSMEYFDAGGVSLGTFAVPTAGNQGLSFLGVRFDAGERIGGVRISLGANFIVSNGVSSGADDLVVLDDFIYGEPVPEPATMGLLGLGGAMVVLGRRRK